MKFNWAARIFASALVAVMAFFAVQYMAKADAAEQRSIRLESQYDQIIKRLERIENKVDGIHP